MGNSGSRSNAIVKSLVANPVGLNYSERGYFRFHATHPDRGPFVGARIKSKIGRDLARVARAGLTAFG
jgi:hypothetical protein